MSNKDDCISRQAAIDAITGALMPSTPLSAVIRAKNRLKELPSAQPDHNADVSKKVDVDDCISKQAAIDLFPNDALEWDTKGGYIAPHLARRMIEELPSAQPERKKGQWLRYGEDGYPNNEDTVFWQCDQCLEQYAGRAKKIPNFCPNCGADMRKENES